MVNGGDKMKQRKLVWLVPIIVVAGIIVYFYPFGDTEDQEPPIQIDQLFGSNWILQSLMIEGQEVTFSEESRVTIQFDEDGDAEGSGGCNTFSGEYQTGAGGSLSFGAIVWTEMACLEPEDIMEQETQFFSALNMVASFQLMPDSLTLSSQDEQTFLRFGLEYDDKGEDTVWTLQCGIGPIEPGEVGGEPAGDEPPQPQFQPRCPAVPPENVQPIFALATCSFGKDEKECTPIPVSQSLGSEIPQIHFNLINPNPGVQIGCAGDLFVTVLSTSNGGAEISWEGLEKDPQTCNQIGPDLTGSTTLPGPCCHRSIDIHYPEQDFTFRVLVQMDWED